MLRKQLVAFALVVSLGLALTPGSLAHAESEIARLCRESLAGFFFGNQGACVSSFQNPQSNAFIAAFCQQNYVFFGFRTVGECTSFFITRRNQP
jgi:hypothetical protein